MREVASEPLLWEPLALARWPGADAEEGYAGDWHALYTARAPQPLALPLAADRARTVTTSQRRQQEQRTAATAAAIAECSSSGAEAEGPARAPPACGGSSSSLAQLAFEDVMRQVFSAGMACTSSRALRRTAEFRGMKRDLTWWATERPEVVVAFVRSAHELLAGSAGVGTSGRGWTEAPWRRSAVAFLQDLGLLGGAHASVVNRVTAEAAGLDRAIRSAQREAGAAAAAVPAGVPASHWWFA